MLGLLMIGAGGVLACVGPAQRLLAQHRFQRVHPLGEALREAIIAPVDDAFDALIARLP